MKSKTYNQILAQKVHTGIFDSLEVLHGYEIMEAANGSSKWHTPLAFDPICSIICSTLTSPVHLVGVPVVASALPIHNSDSEDKREETVISIITEIDRNCLAQNEVREIRNGKKRQKRLMFPFSCCLGSGRRRFRRD